MRNKIIITACCLVIQNIVLGQEWKIINSGTDYILFDISIPSGQNNIAYATGSQFTTADSEGIVIKSTDGGETWTKIYPLANEIGLHLEKIEFINENKGFACGYNGAFLKTEDAGNSWTTISPADDIYVYNNLDFYDEHNGIFMAAKTSGELVVYTTNDGGENWIQSESTPLNTVVDIDYGDASTLYAVGFNSSITKSEDGGNTWNLISQPNWPINVGISFKDALNGFYAGEEGDLHFTADGGITWTESLFTGWHHFMALSYQGVQTFAAGTNQDVYVSYDNGLNWEIVYDGPGESQLYEVAFFEDGHGLVCGSQGTMLKFSPIFVSDLTVSTIDGEDNEIIVDESLQLQAQVSPDYLDQTVEWSIISGNEFITVENSTVTGINEGTAVVRATSILDNSIYEDFEIIVSEKMNVSEIDSNSTKVYPNPIKDVVNISSKNEITSVAIYNTIGQKIMDMPYDKVSGTINLQSLIPGNYLVFLTLKSGKIVTTKIIKK